MSVACAILALGDVVCTWSDVSQTYICSGEGSQVVIGGGGPSGGGPVITNELGSCTNCSAISPQALARLADDLDTYRGLIFEAAGEVLDACDDMRDDLEARVDEIHDYRVFSILSPATATNYMHTASNAQAEAMLYAYNRQGSDGNKRNFCIGAGNGVYYYANNSVLPALNSTLSQIYDIEQRANFIQTGTVSNSGGGIDGIVADMRAGAVACRNCGDGDGDGDGCGGTNTTMWCTFEQGEAMKSLLSEMSNYLASCSAKLASISNYTYEAWQAIRSGLFTDYNAIPAQAQLGDWKQIYLDGSETNWGYAPTNILARIELLLYGLTGVGTNQNTYTEGDLNDTEVMDSIEEDIDEGSAQLRAIDTDADGQAATSLGSALVRFIGAFTPRSSSLQAEDEIVPSVSYRVGTGEFYVPSLNVGTATLSIHNSLQSISATLFGVIYAVGCAWCIFLYWRWFAERAVLMSKWAVELITSLFAS